MRKLNDAQRERVRKNLRDIIVDVFLDECHSYDKVDGGSFVLFDPIFVERDGKGIYVALDSIGGDAMLFRSGKRIEIEDVVWVSNYKNVTTYTTAIAVAIDGMFRDWKEV